MGRLGLRGRPRREGVVRGLAAQLVGEDGLGGPVWREAQVGCGWPKVTTIFSVIFYKEKIKRKAQGKMRGV